MLLPPPIKLVRRERVEGRWGGREDRSDGYCTKLRPPEVRSGRFGLREDENDDCKGGKGGSPGKSRVACTQISTGR